MVELVQNGFVTPDGKRVIDEMNRQIEEAEKAQDIEALNKLSGHVKHYYVNVCKMALLSEAEWLRDHSYGAGVVFSALEEAAQEAAEKQEIKDGQNAITEALESLKAQMQAQIDALKTELAEARKPKGRKQQTETTDEETPAESE